MGRMKLFDDNGGPSDDDLSKIEIDHEYKKRMEHNKKREELQRYEELKKQGKIDDSGDDEDDEDDEDEEELLKPSKKLDSKFLDVLIKIKKKDPILNDKNAKFYDSDDLDESDSDSEDKGVKRKKEKKVFLKDYNSQLSIKEGAEFDDEESDEDKRRMVKSYAEEQEELKRNVLKAVEEQEDDDDGELFKVKDQGGVENDEGEEEIAEKLDVFFGEDGELDEGDKFLKKYLVEKLWIDKEKSKDIGDDIELSEDEEAIEKQEDYERGFNFRFEENAGDRVMGHARKVEGSVRKVNNARKSQRERKEERMAQADFERKEEVKRLKNLKRKEINEKLEKIRKVAGIGNDGDIAVDLDDLEKDFDPEEHDRKMKELYDDDYYNADDADPNFASDDDDELLGLSKDLDISDIDLDIGSDKEDDGLEKPESGKEDEDSEEDDGLEKPDSGEEDGDNEPKEGKRKRKRKSSEEEKAKAVLMDEYYKLDHEGVIGDLKTRFKYKSVPAKRFGLNTSELLMVDEKELNQYVPLKKLAPYREDGWKVRREKIIEIKKKIKESRGSTSKSSKKHKKRQDSVEAATEVVETLEDDKPQPKSSKKHKKRQNSGDAATEVVETLEDDKSQLKESNDGTGLSRRSKRRRSMKDAKPSKSRLEAYGLI